MESAFPQKNPAPTQAPATPPRNSSLPRSRATDDSPFKRNIQTLNTDQFPSQQELYEVGLLSSDEDVNREVSTVTPTITGAKIVIPPSLHNPYQSCASGYATSYDSRFGEDATTLSSTTLDNNDAEVGDTRRVSARAKINVDDSTTPTYPHKLIEVGQYRAEDMARAFKAPKKDPITRTEIDPAIYSTFKSADAPAQIVSEALHAVKIRPTIVKNNVLASETQRMRGMQSTELAALTYHYLSALSPDKKSISMPVNINNQLDTVTLEEETKDAVESNKRSSSLSPKKLLNTAVSGVKEKFTPKEKKDTNIRITFGDASNSAVAENITFQDVFLKYQYIRKRKIEKLAEGLKTGYQTAPSDGTFFYQHSGKVTIDRNNSTAATVASRFGSFVTTTVKCYPTTSTSTSSFSAKSEAVSTAIVRSSLISATALYTVLYEIQALGFIDSALLQSKFIDMLSLVIPPDELKDLSFGGAVLYTVHVNGEPQKRKFEFGTNNYYSHMTSASGSTLCGNFSSNKSDGACWVTDCNALGGNVPLIAGDDSNASFTLNIPMIKASHPTLEKKSK